MKLHEREYEFACIVWDNEPLSSRALARLCEEKMGWKRTTTYTVLRKLCEKGVLKNDHALVTSLVKKEDVRWFSAGLCRLVHEGSLAERTGDRGAAHADR